jgi:hypothetical protein
MRFCSMSAGCQLSRREFLAGAATAGVIATNVAALDAFRSPMAKCVRCGGSGLVPLKDAKPFVWLAGTPLPKLETAVDEQACPVCQPVADPVRLAAAAKERIDAAIEKQRVWEERTGWKLLLVVTRHAAVHTQLTAARARTVGMALESLTLHLQRVTGSLELTPTRPNTYELIILWEKPSWDHFRTVMERLYTREELGESWVSVRQYDSYDHAVTPHIVETPESIRARPPTCGPVFLAARRQINVATAWHAPLWLSEGFAAYGDYAVHKVNRWFSIYDAAQAPLIGDWMVEARRLAREAELRPWSKLAGRELRDWKSADYVQTMAMVTFLLESEPQKFLDFARRLMTGQQDVAALEDAYSAKFDELDLRCQRWLLARR